MAKTPSTSRRTRTVTSARSRWLGPDGKRLRRKVSGKTKQEVRDKLKAIHAELNAGLQPSAGYTVRPAVDDWLDEPQPGRSGELLSVPADAPRSHSSEIPDQGTHRSPGGNFLRRGML
jgi:hypothetical protein